jgi:isoleucyl-tRNA synthetase
MYQNLVRAWDPSTAESVHLCAWPAVDEALIDHDLSASVRLVQRLTSLGRAARAKANLKVRQPLAAVHVRLQTAGEAAIIRQLADQVIEELNVKALAVTEAESDIFDYQVRLNLPVLGAKYGSSLADMQRAFAAADKAALARRALAGLPAPLGTFELQPDELLVTTAGKPGYAVAEEAGYAVAVTTEITPALADEGLARELVRRIQEMRKSAGFDIADRIRLSYEGDAGVARVMEDWRDYIAQETLAASISAGAGTGYAADHDIDGRKLRLAVEKA